MLNTKVNDVMFPDGVIQQFSVNIIAESLYKSSDEDGHRYQYIEEIIEHKKLNTAVSKADGIIKTNSGQNRKKITTKGWKFLVCWKDGLQSWVSLKIRPTVEEAYELDKQNGDSHWKDVVKKEMENIMIAFKVLDPSERVPVRHSRLKVHLVFGIQLDLTRKARLVADGHLTPDPVDSTYDGVVSRETVRIALTYATLHGLYL